MQKEVYQNTLGILYINLVIGRVLRMLCVVDEIVSIVCNLLLHLFTSDK